MINNRQTVLFPKGVYMSGKGQTLVGNGRELMFDLPFLGGRKHQTAVGHGEIKASPAKSLGHRDYDLKNWKKTSKLFEPLIAKIRVFLRQPERGRTDAIAILAKINMALIHSM